MYLVGRRALPLLLVPLLGGTAADAVSSSSSITRPATQRGVPRYPTYPPRALEPKSDPRSWDIEEVQNWVESVGFHEYRSAFAEAKIDGQQLLSMSAEDMAKKLSLSGNELTAVIGMEIDELRERRGLLSAAELQALHEVHPPPDKWSAKDVAGMLRDAGLDAYSVSFEKAEIDGPALLRLRPTQMQELLANAVPDNPHEQNEAAAELIAALQEHLRWRASNGRLEEGEEGSKDEL